MQYTAYTPTLTIEEHTRLVLALTEGLSHARQAAQGAREDADITHMAGLLDRALHDLALARRLLTPKHERHRVRLGRGRRR
jgi:hypothetical protein